MFLSNLEQNRSLLNFRAIVQDVALRAVVVEGLEDLAESVRELRLEAKIKSILQGSLFSELETSRYLTVLLKKYIFSKFAVEA